ncbi:MAG: XRE family transcriptional regulator [Myxococcaceae bacterium]|nr:MAG: XRE family transcriptional regulator [Myxococcaceae bacterium]
MAARPKTGFDRYFDDQMRDPAFSAEYRQARAEIDAVDTLIRALDEARQRSGLTKAGLARRIDAKPEIVRRLLTEAGSNPTMTTVLKLASAVDCHLELVPHAARRDRARRQIAMPARRSRSAEAAAASQQARLRAMSARERILLALRLSRRFRAPGRLAR